MGFMKQDEDFVKALEHVYGRRATQKNKLRLRKCAVNSHEVLLSRGKGCFTKNSMALVIYLMSQKLFMIPFVLFSTISECFME